jgi:sulfur-oxidizing protein SoxX
MKLAKSLLIASALSGLIATSSFAADDALVKKGEKIFMTKNLGNCLACHAANGKNVDGPGSMGPKLQALQYWPTEALYQKIYDPYTTNPISAMPAFGKNGWLDDSEIKALVAYLKTIK